MSSRLRELAAALLPDVPGVADVHMLCSSSSSQPYSYWKDIAKMDKRAFHTDIETALGLMTTGRNDVLLVSAENHSQADSITWSKNMTHLVGMYPSSMMNLRSRIGHSANFDKLLDVTGYGNLFKNLYLMYGRGNAANLTCLQITGNRNTFKHCHFAAPLHTTEGDQATFKVIGIAETSGGDGLEHYFDHCVIGAETAAWTNGDMIKYSGTPRMIFEDCLFIMRPDNAQVTFIDGTAGDGQGFVLFKNCTGINLGSTLTVAIGSTGLAAGTDYILHNSGFQNCTGVIAAADEAKLWGVVYPGNATDDVNLGKLLAYDHTA